jgi:hypothetical protein
VIRTSWPANSRGVPDGDRRKVESALGGVFRPGRMRLSASRTAVRPRFANGIVGVATVKLLGP